MPNVSCVYGFEARHILRLEAVWPEPVIRRSIDDRQ